MADMLDALPGAAQRKARALVGRLPPNWTVGKITTVAAPDGTTWQLFLLDERGRDAATAAVFCSVAELNGK